MGKQILRGETKTAGTAVEFQQQEPIFDGKIDKS